MATSKEFNYPGDEERLRQARETMAKIAPNISPDGWLGQRWARMTPEQRAEHGRKISAGQKRARGSQRAARIILDSGN